MLRVLRCQKYCTRVFCFIEPGYREFADHSLGDVVLGKVSVCITVTK